MRFLSLFVFCLPLLAQAALPMPDHAAAQRDSSALQSKLMPAKDEETTFLDPDQAFKLTVSARDTQTLVADFVVAPGYYLYQKRISLKLKEGSASTIASTDLPKGEMKNDPNFGDMEVYHHPFQVVVHLQRPASAPSNVTLLAKFQGCSEKGLCYAPINKIFDVDTGNLSTANQPPAHTPDISATAPNDSDKVQKLLGGGKLWLIAVGFFGFGLLLSFTPCVFPMIPILSGIIVGQGSHPTRLHAFNLSLAYTLGMAVAYALAGIAAGLSGHLISNALQNPWVLGTGSLVFVALALSMFGFYELRLPSAMETRMAETTNHIKGGKFLSVFVMGSLSALIVSPCVAAPLAGALLYIGQTHDVVLGGVALFMLALGMGVPLLLVGLSAGALLPRAGAWMNIVRNFFGVLMLGIAIWLVAPVIPATLQMALWATLLIISAIYLNALDALPSPAGKAARFGKGVGVIALVSGIVMLLGAFTGSHDPLKPLEGVAASAGVSKTLATKALPFKRVRNVAELDAALQLAKGKQVMLDFYADWCTSCKEYEKFTFTDSDVQKQLNNVVLLQADVTNNTANDSALLARFHLFGPPGIVFFDQQGNEMQSRNVVGYQDAPSFLATLSGAIKVPEGECTPTQQC